MTIQTDTRRPVDKVMIAALKKADRIVFRHTPAKGSQIEAIKAANPTKSNPFDQEVTVTVPTSFAVDDYGGHGTEQYPGPERALSGSDMASGNFYGFEMEHTPQSARHWQTIVATLRAGDMIGLRWRRNAGTNPGIYRLGVVMDDLWLWVERGDKCVGSYLVDARATTLANAESHRMVRTRAY
jgi:hypothetical protein